MADVRGTGPGGGTGQPAPGGWPRKIEAALRRDLFVLHAQRIVDVESGETLRHELFLRLAEAGGLVPAGDFVVAAEQQGSIRDIDRWVLARAVELAAQGHPVALNLSVRSADDELVEATAGLIERVGADPSKLVMELAEPQLLAGLESGTSFVRRAHQLGCRIALDGYVSGGRASALLKSLPIEFVKLGPPFVSGLSADGRRRRKTRNAAAKALESGQRVIAQGVEDLITLQLLEELGIDEAQGYALGRPEPLDAAFRTPG